jgi:hypothetical protein
MATLIVGLAGYLGASAGTAAAIGTAVSAIGTAATVASIGYSVYSALNQPSQRTEGPRLGDLKVQSSARGVPIPKVWGSMRISGNLIDGKKYEVRTEESVGGKGFMGGGGGTQVSYNYFADFAVSLCEGPITGVRRIWLNNKLWYTAAEDASETELRASDDNERYGKLYLGTTSQLPDPTLEAIHGAGNVPPYRRTAYIVFTRLPLLNFGNAIPQVSVEVCNTAARFTDPTTLPGGDPGGLYNSQITRDPETGRFFLVNFGVGSGLRVFNSLGQSIALITLPNKGQDGAATPCYVPTTREIWVHYAQAVAGPPYYWSNVAIIDPDSLAVKTYFAVNQIGAGPCFYNPARDEVVINEWNSGAAPLLFNPHDRTSTIGTGFGGLCVSIEYIAPHQVMAVIVTHGVWSNTSLIDATDYSNIATWTPSGFGVSGSPWMSYDAGRDLLYYCDGDSLHLYSIDLSVLPGGTPVLGATRTLPYKPLSGFLYENSTDKIYLLRSSAGADLLVLNPDTLAVEGQIGTDFGGSGGLYHLDGRRFITSGDNYLIPIRPLLENTGVLLSQIVNDICRDGGLAGADFTTTGLNNTVHGYVRAQPMQATAALQPLMLTYQFDGVESDYLLTFPKRDGSSVATIPEDDLGAHEIGQDPGPPLAISRMQETDLPTALSIHYTEPALAYQQGSQIHRRVYTRSQQTMQIDLPIAMSSIAARRLTRRLMNRSWVERTRYRFAVGPEYLALDPGDIVKVIADNATHLVRLDKVDYGSPGLVLAEGVAQRITLLPYLDEVAADLDAAPIYEEGEEEPPPDTFPTPTLVPVPATLLVLLDIPILRDADSDAGFYYAVAGYTTAGWAGMTLFKSTDSGATYASWDAMSTPAAIGSATTALASGPTTIWDRGSSVNVVLTQGTLASDTEANVLNGANLGAIGVHGRWEIIQWATATLQGDGSYTLTNLIRGRKGTEHAVASHAIGDLFVALTPATIDRAAGATSEIGLARYWKGVSFGRLLAEASGQAFTNGAVGLECYAPAHLRAEDNGDGTWDVSWLRRTRMDGEMRPLVEVPLGEASEAYSVELLNVGTPVSTATVSVQSATITASAGYTVRVAQISELVGPGYYSEITL